MKKTILTREQWLENAVTLFEKGPFKRSGLAIPRLKVSVGFPYASRGSRKIAECWAPEHAEDKKSQIFIGPTISKEVEVLSTLAHELVHAAVGCKEGHNKVYRKAALAVGLTGPMRSTLPGPALLNEIATVVGKIGPYPHSKLNISHKKKQSTRLYKIQCLDCGYTARVTRKYIYIRGPLICPCNFRSMHIDDIDFENLGGDDAGSV